MVAAGLAPVELLERACDRLDGGLGRWVEEQDEQVHAGLAEGGELLRQRIGVTAHRTDALRKRIDRQALGAGRLHVELGGAAQISVKGHVTGSPFRFTMMRTDAGRSSGPSGGGRSQANAEVSAM